MSLVVEDGHVLLLVDGPTFPHHQRTCLIIQDVPFQCYSLSLVISTRCFIFNVSLVLYFRQLTLLQVLAILKWISIGFSPLSTLPKLQLQEGTMKRLILGNPP